MRQPDKCEGWFWAHWNKSGPATIPAVASVSSAGDVGGDGGGDMGACAGGTSSVERPFPPPHQLFVGMRRFRERKPASIWK